MNNSPDLTDLFQSRQKYVIEIEHAGKRCAGIMLGPDFNQRSVRSVVQFVRQTSTVETRDGLFIKRPIHEFIRMSENGTLKILYQCPFALTRLLLLYKKEGAENAAFTKLPDEIKNKPVWRLLYELRPADFTGLIAEYLRGLSNTYDFVQVLPLSHEKSSAANQISSIERELQNEVFPVNDYYDFAEFLTKMEFNMSACEIEKCAKYKPDDAPNLTASFLNPKHARGLLNRVKEILVRKDAKLQEKNSSTKTLNSLDLEAQNDLKRLFPIFENFLQQHQNAWYVHKYS